MNGVQDNSSSPSITSPGRSLPGQIVLVLQGGGALATSQAEVDQALDEAGIGRSGDRQPDRRHQRQPYRRQ
jgi:NTE family protein